jgi:uncharacterized membrane protein
MKEHRKLPLVPERGTKLTREKLNEHFHSNLHFSHDWKDMLADFLTRHFGTISFLIVNCVFFTAWFVVNTGMWGLKPFDPYPFNFLTMTVSLEAIFLSVIVLITQNRQSKIADIRQQMDFEIDVRSEEEITKILYMVDDLRKAAGIKAHDPELEAMKHRLDLEQMQKEAEDSNRQ